MRRVSSLRCGLVEENASRPGAPYPDGSSFSSYLHLDLCGGKLKNKQTLIEHYRIAHIQGCGEEFRLTFGLRVHFGLPTNANFVNTLYGHKNL